MGRMWVKLAGLGILGLALIGCRTTQQPDLKPPNSPETLTPPPSDARYNSPGYPKEALVNRDPQKKPGDIVPAQGFGSQPGRPGYP
ncbi:MAG: hypothetical protein HY040_17770 [Planctomycetes bacterium]|nr:hypothetical protein [Planctomycetota bacterium]